MPSQAGVFEHIAVLYHPKIEATEPVAEEICAWLQGQGLTAWRALTWDEESVRPRLADCDLVIVLGGDGSILRTSRMAANCATPLLGINMGRLGFLSEASPDNWREKLPAIFSGDYWIESRMMLKAAAWRGDQQLCEHLALNDVVISRGTLARVVRLRTEIDGERLTTYIADGLIVSTPTGSTAYALAVGGPVLPPALRNILVIPIAPHLTLDRAIVLSEGALVKVNVGTDYDAILTVDGQYAVDLVDGDRIEVSTSDLSSHFVRTGKRNYFYHMLLDRLEPRQIDDKI
ncbi:MAG: NAD(+)/NADH kinase [Anaerolineae bacterium]|nr:NAD(+)/NADH kinase [Anaerolineae bacterium]